MRELVLSVTRMFADHVDPPAVRRAEYTFHWFERKSLQTATAAPSAVTAIFGSLCVAEPRVSSFTRTFALHAAVVGSRREK